MNTYSPPSKKNSSLPSSLFTLLLLMTTMSGFAQIPSRNGALELWHTEWSNIEIGASHQNLLAGSTQPFTVEMWLWTNGNPGNDFNLFKFVSGSREISLSQVSNNGLSLALKGTPYGNMSFFFDTDVNYIDQWHHIAFTYDGNDYVTIVLDGNTTFARHLSKDNVFISDWSPAGLLPDAGSGYFWQIGGESALGVKGNGLLADIRIFNAAVPTSTLKSFYDEAINGSHPYWNNLIRYYAMNSDYVPADGRARFPDNQGQFDAIAWEGNSSIRIRYDHFPPIKPPRPFARFNMSAETCQTDNAITITWNNVNGDYFSMPSGTRINYELVRKDQSVQLLESESTTYTLSTLPAGSEIDFALRSVWQVNGVKKYSDTELVVTGSTKEVFDAPNNVLVSTNRCDELVRVSWNNGSKKPPMWKVMRDDASDFSNSPVTLYEGANTITTFDDNTADIDKTYYYKVVASGTDKVGCSISGVESSVIEGRTSLPPSPPVDLTVIVDEVNSELDITWADAAGNNATGFILTRENEDGTNKVEILKTLNTSTTSYSDADINLCQSYRYKIATYNDCALDGVFSEATQTGLLGADLSNVITDFSASTGYFSGYVRLEWAINGSLSQVDRFRIYRTRAGQDNYQLIKVVENDLIFDDYTAVPGTFYNYRVAGESLCNDQIVFTNELVALGFRQPFGVANGHVEYAGGNAVEGVQINFEKQGGTQQGRSIFFDGVDDYIEVPAGGKWADLSIEFWMRSPEFSESDNVSIMDYGEWAIRGNGTSITWLTDWLTEETIDSVMGPTPLWITDELTATTNVGDGQWHQVTVVKDGENKRIYIDGVLENQSVLEKDGPFHYDTLVFIGKSKSANGYGQYKGNLDEIRMWNRALTSEEIATNYNRIIGSEQTGIIAYFRCDEGLGNTIYDVSVEEEVFNKRNGEFKNGTRFTTVIPPSEYLGVKALANEYGDFSAPYIPYTGAGNTFQVTASLGQHEFQPSSRAIYLGDGSQVQNGIDFTDISSFTVTGQVTYENSEVPVEGVAIYIDGKQAVGIDNQPVRTDDDGNYEIQVPIGFHYLSPYKEGHTFSVGVFPELNQHGDIQLHEFTEDLTVNFVDDTRVIVAGRIIGGNREGDKKLGFGKSVNNIGLSDLFFNFPNDAYDVDTTSNGIYSTISLTTDERTGEYSLSLLPEQWVVTRAGNDRYLFDTQPVIDLSNSLELLYELDTTYNGDGTILAIDSFAYHKALNFIIKANPIIEVYGANSEAFDGEDSISFISQHSGEDTTIYLGDQNPFDFDFYEMGVDYEANIYVYETYINPDHPDYADTLVDKVPVKNAEITINDNIMINPAASTGKTDGDGHLQYFFRAGMPNLSSNGVYSYTKTFEVEAQVEGLGITWNDGNPYRAYVLGAAPLEGTDFITFGPDLADFVLRDPPGSNSYAYLEEGSSFTIAENWQMNLATNQGLDLNTYSGFLLQAGGGLAGPVVKNETINSSEIGLSIERYFDYDGTMKRKVTFNKRIETSSDPEDVGGMADLYIGRSINAFVNETQNLKLMTKTYCEQHGLDYFGDGDLVLGIIKGFAINESTEQTYFAYSQKHILYDLIPQYYLLRNTLLMSDKYESHLDIDHPCYGASNDSKCIQNQFPLDASPNLSYTFTPSTVGEIDSVDYMNDQITNWLNIIATNEGEKAKATTQTNLSIDGSSGAYSSSITEEYSGEYNWNTSRKVNLKWNSEFTNITNNAGLGIESIFNMDLNVGVGGNNSQVRNLKFGYVIDERDEGDYYSIDVKKGEGVTYFDTDDFVDNLPSKDEFMEEQLIRAGIAGGVTLGGLYVKGAMIGNGIGNLLGKASNANAIVASLQFGVDLTVWVLEMVNVSIQSTDVIDKASGITSTQISGFNIGSPIFSVRGGQTRCPYEPAEYANFYLDNTNNLPQLNVATLKREVPVLNVVPAIRSNVPESEAATFTLSLGNESESGTDVWYELSVVESSNPDGAILRIDGNTVERSFLVPAYETVNKTLTLEMGATAVMDYDSIGIVLHSICQADPANLQNDIADTVWVSAHFLPVCSDVTISNISENWIANYDDDDQVPVTLGSYDINMTTLETVSFEYKTLSGTPITVMTYFKEDDVDYQNYDGAKGLLSGGEVSFVWDIGALNDRQYHIRAKSTCSDDSETVSDYLLGRIDRSTPVVFGTPEPADGIYESGDELRIRFSEQLEADLVKDHHISVKSVLNGADVKHATSVQFDGVDDDLSIDQISFNSGSFTIEYWSKFEVESPTDESIMHYSSDGESVTIKRSGDQLVFSIDSHELATVPTYPVAAPWNSWHHWAFVYDQEQLTMKVYMDDQLVGTKDNVIFLPVSKGTLHLGNGSFVGKMHELRLWQDVRTFGELVANMSATLNGRESGLYGYWPMAEGKGAIALDKTSGRHGHVSASWSLEPGGYSWEFAGTSHVLMDGSNVLIDEETDMTVEFWFKAAASGDTIMLISNGPGDGAGLYADPTTRMAIYADGDGLLHVLSNGYDFQATNTSFMDNNWHHLALVLDRRSNTSMYIDGLLKNQTPSSNLSGFSGAKIALGARMNPSVDGNTTYDLHYTGFMDEVRFWNSVRKKVLIETYMHTKLERNDPGLVAYLPFETYETTPNGTYLMTSSLVDQVINSDLSSVSDAFSSDGTTHYSDQKPAVKDLRGLQDIPFSYSVNDDEVIIIPNVDLYRIEGQTLEISIRNVQDLYGNRMLSPATWTAFVQQNQVKWDEPIIHLEKHIDKSLSFKTSFTNSSGTAYAYTLENIPVWLSASTVSGIANPQETVEINFQVNDALNIGSYGHGINLSTDLGFEEKLSVNIRVHGNEPDWTVDEEDFEFTMSVIGSLIINGENSTDVYDQVGAFVGDELRGVANVEYVSQTDGYLVFLSIYSNLTSGEDITLKAYDASTGYVHSNVTPEIAFVVDDVLGSVLTPIAITSGDQITRDMALTKGWNWVSFNLNDPRMLSVATLFENIGTDGDLVKSQTAFDMYSQGSGWFGTLTGTGGFNTTSMYKVFVQNAGTIQLSGVPTSVETDLTVITGWNFIGFLPQVKMSLDEALVSMDPEDGDVLKTKTKFSMYSSSYGWVGSLRQMEPGQGYMLFSADASTIRYPKRASLNSRISEDEILNPDIFQVQENESGNTMSVIARVGNMDSLSSEKGQALVAYTGDEITGYAYPMEVNGHQLYFISIAAETDQNVTFKLYDTVENTFSELEGTVMFAENKIVGDLVAPKQLTLNQAPLQTQVTVWPNPFAELLHVQIPFDEGSVSYLKILSLDGKEVLQKTISFSTQTPLQKIILKEEIVHLKSGMYVLQIRQGDELYETKIVK